jgi:hypothetical protein
MWLLRSPEGSRPGIDADFPKSYFVKLVSPKVLYILSIIVVLSLLVSTAFLFLGYVGDEWGNPPTNERSFPAPKKY